ncbi:MAG: T9SS type A sorting domain-containing protein [Saprospiraceae bacterium]
MRLLFSLGLLLLANFSLQAQLQEAIISHNPTITKAAKKQTNRPANKRNQKGAALPFFDDFAYAGPFPDGENWMDNTVFINNTLANQPISIGVATFDGLDATGSPYGGTGSADSLTSIPLDLSGNAPKYMSYYVQPKGLGDAPGPEDSLILEFKNIAGEWVEVGSHATTVRETLFPLDSLPVFQFVGPIAIEDAQFLHEDFQFRFRNYAFRNGAVDMWHIDYIRVEADVITQSNSDLAFTNLPSNILRDYANAPWTHLQDELENDLDLILTTMDVQVYNHSGNTISTSDSEFLVNGISEGQTLRFKRQTLLDPANDLAQANIGSGRDTFTNPVRGEYAFVFRNEFQTSDNVQIRADYSFTQNNTEPEGTQRNNQVSRTFNFDNYYAYDDDSAESAYFIGTGGQVAVKFTNYKADLLQAIRLQIPRIVGGDLSNTNFKLKVWLEDLNTTPVYEGSFQPLFIDEFVDSLQAFTTYVLNDPLTGEATPIDLPVGDFYIGWQQVTSCANVNCLPVGFDRNTPAATNTIFINIDGGWRNISTFFQNEEVPPSQQGALMMRPVVGPETPNDSETVSVAELAVPQLLAIFPNPTNGIISIDLFDGNYDAYQINVFNTLGQQLKQQDLTPQMDLSTQTAGIYFLQFIHKETLAIGNYKLVLKK